MRYIINRIINWLFLYEQYLTRMRRKALKKLVLRTRFFQRLTTHHHIKKNQLIILYITDKSMFERRYQNLKKKKILKEIRAIVRFSADFHRQLR